MKTCMPNDSGTTDSQESLQVVISVWGVGDVELPILNSIGFITDEARVQNFLRGFESLYEY